MNKMAIVSSSFSIITLNLNGLKSSKDIEGLNGFFFKDPNTCCLKKLTLKTNSGWNWRDGKKDIPFRHNSKENWNSFINIKVDVRKEISLTSTTHWKGLLHNEEGFKFPRRQKH